MLILGALGVEEEQMAHGALSAISGALIVAACLAGSLFAVSRRAFVPVVIGEIVARVVLGAAVWMSSRRQATVSLLAAGSPPRKVSFGGFPHPLEDLGERLRAHGRGGYAAGEVAGRRRMRTSSVVFAVGTGVVVIVVAIAVVLVVLFVTVAMRGGQKRGAQQRGEARRDVEEARERAGRAERERDIARAGGEDPDSDPER
jgi:hypothetical protein